MPRVCVTRALKNARYIHAVAPHIIPAQEPVEGFFSLIPLHLLLVLHEKHKTPVQGLPDLNLLLSAVKLPLASNQAVDPLFNGTLHLVQVSFETNGGAVSVSDADIAVAVQYSTLVAGPISAYSTQYGQNGLTVSRTVIKFTANVATARYNDQILQGWVNAIVSQNALPNNSGIIILNPQGVTNTDGNIAQGILGYHGKANIPYCFVNVFGQNLTIQDHADVYALQLSHEIAEMTVDPNVDGQNPEVCDACGPNCPPTWRDFFLSNVYSQTSDVFPPSFAYDFFINAIVQPNAAIQCPAPQNACAYPPPDFWHTLRRTDGTWTGLGEVQGQFAVAGVVTIVAAASGLPGETQFMFTTSDGHLWHTLRRADGTWTGLGDVQSQFGIPGPVKAVAGTGGASGEAQFMFTTSDGHLWHTLRRADGTWTGLGDVQGQFGIPGPVTAVAAASGLPGETQFMFTTSDGHLWHTLRRADGTWTGLGDVQSQFAIPGPVKAVAGTGGASGEAQFMFTTSDGHLWHTLRRADGSWTGLGDVQGQFGIPGPVTAVAAASGLPGETQFMFTTSDGHLWHTLRRANGTWTGLGDVQSQFAIPGPVKAVAGTGGASGEAQFMFTT